MLRCYLVYLCQFGTCGSGVVVHVLLMDGGPNNDRSLSEHGVVYGSSGVAVHVLLMDGGPNNDKSPFGARCSVW